MKKDMVKECAWVRLGDFIEECDERNREGIYTLEDVTGISIDKKLIPTKANMDGVSLIPYKILKPKEFCYVPVTSRNGQKITIALNTTTRTHIVSSSYETFRTKEGLLPEYLYLLLSRSEFDRYARFNSWGSARETFDWSEMCRTLIPLPTIEEQRELVSAYAGLKQLAEDNEAVVLPLTQACQAFIADCKNKYPTAQLGDFIEECDERNRDLSVKLSQGIANTKVFQTPKQVAANSKSDKIVRNGQFAYNRATTRNGEKISIAYRTGEDCTVSSAYGVFQIKDEQKLDPYFLWMWVSRSEFDRYARYMSKGSAHEFFDWNEMCRTLIPLPPIEVQQSIVSVYRCIEEAKAIAAEARERLQTLCPALLQKAVHTPQPTD